jgi:4Fe-4S ferredoxin
LVKRWGIPREKKVPVRYEMPFKTLKKDTANSLTLEWVLQVKNYKLTLDKQRCAGCQICMQACPKQAITIQKQPKLQSGSAKKAKVDVDLSKCNFCGICDVTCPYGAVKVTQNGGRDLSVLTKDSYPQLIRDIVVDTRKCDKECIECETACPLKLIKISKAGYDGKPVEDLSALSPLGRKRVQVTVDIQKEYCPTCRACEFKCSSGSIRVKKIFEGSLAVNQEKCPEGCRDCVDVCPITGTLTLDENGKVVADEQTCTFCGACKNVCPQTEALTVHRTKVYHTPIHSGAWNKTLARTTSPADAVKEFKAQATKARRELVAHRFEVEEMKKK